MTSRQIDGDDINTAMGGSGSAGQVITSVGGSAPVWAAGTPGATGPAGTTGASGADGAIGTSVGRGRTLRGASLPINISTGRFPFSTSTKSVLMTVPTDVDFVRILLRNANPSGAMIIKGYAAPTSQVGNGWSSYDSAGAVQTASPWWIPFNFANQGADLSPGEQEATVVNAFSVPNDDKYYWSDWSPITTIPRTDGGSGRLVLLRTQGLTNPWGPQTLGPTGISVDVAEINTSESLFASSQGVSSLGATDFSANGLTHVCAMQYMSRPPGITILTIGSSITGGTATTNLRTTWGRVAAKTLTDAGIPTQCFLSNGPAGLSPTEENLMSEAIPFIKQLKPNIVCIQVANRNNTPYSVAMSDLVWKKAMAMAQYAQDNGAIVILVTATPWASTSAPTAVEDGYRQINNDLARAFANTTTGFALFDYDAVITDGGSPARCQAMYGGNTDHPNDAGHIAAGAVLAGVITKILGISGAVTQDQLWNGLLASLPTSNPGPSSKVPWLNTNVLTKGS